MGTFEFLRNPAKMYKVLPLKNKGNVFFAQSVNSLSLCLFCSLAIDLFPYLPLFSSLQLTVSLFRVVLPASLPPCLSASLSLFPSGQVLRFPVPVPAPVIKLLWTVNARRKHSKLGAKNEPDTTNMHNVNDRITYLSELSFFFAYQACLAFFLFLRFVDFRQVIQHLFVERFKFFIVATQKFLKVHKGSTEIRNKINKGCAF